MEHCQVELLVDHANGLVPELERRKVDVHLAICRLCRERAETFARLAELSPAPEPPPHAVQAARSLFAPRAVRARESEPDSLGVRLLFDSGVGGLALGTRRRGDKPRRQLLELGRFLLDLDVTSEAGAVRVVGQLLPKEGADRLPERLRVRAVRGDGRRLADVVADEQGQFQLQVPPATGVRLRVDVGSGSAAEIELPRA